MNALGYLHDDSDLKHRLLATGVALVREGLVRGVWGNASARTNAGHVLITPSAMPYETLAAADLVTLDADGRHLDGFRKPSSERAMHLAIYRAKPDVFAIVHTHSVFASAFSVAKQGIPPIVEDVAQVVGGEVRLARYEHPGTAALGFAAVEALGERTAALLQNHGVVAVGPDLDEALRVAVIVEKAAQIAAVAKGLGAVHPLPTETVASLRDLYLNAYGQDK